MRQGTFVETHVMHPTLQLVCNRMQNQTSTFTLREVIIVDLLHAIIHTLLATHYALYCAFQTYLKGFVPAIDC